MPALPLHHGLRLVSLLLVLLLAARAGTPGAHGAASIVLVPQQVAPHTWFVQGEPGMASVSNRGFMSNAGFVVTGDGVVVFDALGTPALGRALVAAIRKVTSQPIRRVVVSHYHADHIYGLQAFKAEGAEVWAHRRAQLYVASGQADARLVQRRADLSPWVDEHTRVVAADVVLDGDASFRMGGITFRVIDSEGAHAPEDLMLLVVEDGVLFAGDLLFAGRLPFVGNADSAGWLKAMDKMVAARARVVVPGHGPASRDVERDLALTRDYLLFLRESMARAVAELEPFDTAYAKVDWSRFAALPAFEQANRINAYGTYLLLEQEELRRARR